MLPTTEWNQQTVDLSAYAGQPVKVAFHLALSSPLTTSQGWFLDDLVVSDGQPFQESGGQVAIEAEQFHQAVGQNNRQWLTQTVTGGYTGTGYVQALPDIDARYTSGYTATSPELRFQVHFVTTGTYTIWLRGYAPNAAGDSLHLGLTSTTLTPTLQVVEGLTGFGPREWRWSKQTLKGTVAAFQVTEPGVYVLHLWTREDGFKLDRLLLTLNGTDQPAGFGPP